MDKTTISYSSAVSPCEKGAEWQRDSALPGMMGQEAVKENTIIYSSTVSACEKAGVWFASKAGGSLRLDFCRGALGQRRLVCGDVRLCCSRT